MAALAALGEGAVDERPHPRMAREVVADVLLRDLLVDLGRLRQPERGHAIEDGVVGALGDRTLERRDRGRGDLEHLRGGPRVDVLAASERLDQRRLLGQMREDPQLDLRIVRRNELPPRFRDERLANPAPELGADRDVHEIRILRAEPPGRRHELVERRVDPSGAGIDQPGQGVGVRALELREAPVLEDLRRERMPERQLGQHVGVGRVAGLRSPDRRQLQLLEEDLRELLGRGDRELAAGELIDLARQVVEIALELLRERLEARRVDADAVTLH